MKIYIKLRQSGEVYRVAGIYRHVEGFYWINVPSMAEVQILDKDCDLCDEQGRLLVAEDKTINMDEVLTHYWKDKRFNMYTPLHEVLSAMKQDNLTNTPSEGKEEEK